VTLAETIKDYCNAGFAGIWVQTHEPDEAQAELGKLCRENDWDLHAWDFARGVPQRGGKAEPVWPLDEADAQHQGTHLWLLHNYHKYLANPMVSQHLANSVQEGKSNHTHFIALSPVVQIPAELEKLFVVVEHELPDAKTLKQIADELPRRDAPPASDECVQAATGLTRYEAESAFSLSLGRHGTFKPEEVWELKASTLKKAGLLELLRGKTLFKDLGGMENMKAFARKAFAPGRPVRPKGILILGPSGTGKSAFAVSLGNEVKRAIVQGDMGACKGSLVGETQQKTRAMFKSADAQAPCILFFDEIEKGLAGATGHQGDGGTSADQFGHFLIWSNDHQSDVQLVATCNNINALPPEFARAERWDAIFFLDLPTRVEKDMIWEIYVKAFNIDRGSLPDMYDRDEGWSGAEIKTCCRLAALLDVNLVEASQYVVPVAKTAADKVQALREWASGKCISASSPGVYQCRKEQKDRPRRAIVGKNSQNN
jgi:hypothetical protein